MVQHLFKDFLKDPQGYKKAERYWEELWQKIACETEVSSKWQYPWLGAPLRDGNPMFSAVSSELGLGVHIIQHEPTSEQVELEWWLDKFGEEGIDQIIQQLVICCALSRESSSQAADLMRSWVIRGKIDFSTPTENGRRTKTAKLLPKTK